MICKLDIRFPFVTFVTDIVFNIFSICCKKFKTYRLNSNFQKENW